MAHRCRLATRLRPVSFQGPAHGLRDSPTEAPIHSDHHARAVLWDLDGTLADSREFHWLAWQDTMQWEGRPIERADFDATFGLRNEEILTSWLGNPGEHAIRRVGESKERRYRALVQDAGLEPLPGAAAWVRRLHADGWRQAIASSAPRENVLVMRRVLGFDGLIDTIVGAEDVRRGKPDPEVFLVAAERLALSVERCIVVEDAPAGVEAARRAGMRCIGVGDGGVRADLPAASLAGLPDDAFEALLAAR